MRILGNGLSAHAIRRALGSGEAPAKEVAAQGAVPRLASAHQDLPAGGHGDQAVGQRADASCAAHLRRMSKLGPGLKQSLLLIVATSCLIRPSAFIFAQPVEFESECFSRIAHNDALKVPRPITSTCFSRKRAILVCNKGVTGWCKMAQR